MVPMAVLAVTFSCTPYPGKEVRLAHLEKIIPLYSLIFCHGGSKACRSKLQLDTRRRQCGCTKVSSCVQIWQSSPVWEESGSLYKIYRINIESWKNYFLLVFWGFQPFADDSLQYVIERKLGSKGHWNMP